MTKSVTRDVDRIIHALKSGKFPVMSKIFRMTDFETTGFPPGAAVIEIGWCDVRVDDDGSAEILQPRSMLVNPFRANPELRMSPGAQAVHLIDKADLVDAASVDVGFRTLMDGADAFVAHNAEFERKFFSGGGKPWVCTLKAARRQYPGEQSHALQQLRFSLPLDIADREYARAAHRAGPDAYVTAFLFVRLIQDGFAVDDLVASADGPSLLPRVPFGKHKGKIWSEVPRDYLEWMQGQRDLDKDLKFTLKTELQKRQSNTRF